MDIIYDKTAGIIGDDPYFTIHDLFEIEKTQHNTRVFSDDDDTYSFPVDSDGTIQIIEIEDNEILGILTQKDVQFLKTLWERIQPI
jgi:hypothetical protein